VTSSVEGPLQHARNVSRKANDKHLAILFGRPGSLSAPHHESHHHQPGDALRSGPQLWLNRSSFSWVRRQPDTNRSADWRGPRKQGFRGYILLAELRTNETLRGHATVGSPDRSSRSGATDPVGPRRPLPRAKSRDTSRFTALRGPYEAACHAGQAGHAILAPPG
jgi:hypothetical protein